ncbi:dipeptide ABC transporter ATP-binding protein [Alicyclobacillus sp.]|uniref:ABC transporter ATP-binding protein n=1 Tax=Alicyclobacillus sp. TaxID=61169 RepID=UPI0025C2E01C|nr:dipeptide ABC transporter ATP-binding protein [Alicyclobacillus sp.]MCL6517553.1 dipeptide ABC transporter ATP-binding protein [Alicyclobacillus sp.]
MADTLLEVRDLKTYYPIRSGLLQRVTGYVRAVDGVSFSIEDGETLGLVGESGSGKSTTGRSILRLTEPTSGEVWFEGRNLLTLGDRQMREVRRHLQIIFQDPYASLDPRMTVGQILEEPLLVHGVTDRGERRRRVQELLEVVGLSAYHMHRYAHEFSGGQRQRIGIARALALRPKLVVADEPVSALDVSIQSQVLNLMQDLQEQFQLTYLFIAHDLSVVRHISTRIGVMYLGRLVELGPADAVYDEPLHPYTQALLSAVPIPDPDAKRERIILQGDVPSASNPPTGCAFHPRCPFAMDICRTERPAWKAMDGGRFVACHLHT